MVFNVSSTVQPKEDVEKREIDWEAVPDKSCLIPNKAPQKRSSCCIAFPWLLCFVCFILLAGVSCWGWNEHKKLQEYLECKNKLPSRLVLPESKPLSPLLMTHTPERIPYGDDALEPTLEKETDDDEYDVSNYEENNTDDDDGIQETFKSHPHFPFNLIRIKFPFNFHNDHKGDDRFPTLRYRLFFRTNPKPDGTDETDGTNGSGEE